MSGPESPKPDDQLLEEFLAGEGAVRAAYRGQAGERAPAHLDAAILQSAEIAARPLSRAHRPRWQTPIAAAAVMVLSFGVFLQVQHDPAAQKEVMALPAEAAPAAAPAETMAAAPRAEVRIDADAVREEADARTRQAVPVAAKPKPSPPAEKRRAAAKTIVETPTPAAAPAMAVPSAAPTPAATASPEPQRSAVLDEAFAKSEAADAMVSESMQRQALAPAGAPASAKARSAPTASHLMSGGAARDVVVAPDVEQWARSCETEAIDLVAPGSWRGLAVLSWQRQASANRVQTTLQFAPDVTLEALTAALGSLAARASLPATHCAQPVLRELRRSAAGWSLVCDCAVAKSR